MVHLTCYHPPGQPLWQVQLFGPRGGELLEAAPCWGKWVRLIKSNFSLILRSTCHFLRGLHDGCGPQDYILLLQGQTQEFVEEWLERNNFSNFKVCLWRYVSKFQTNMGLMRTRMFFFWQKKNEEIFLQPCLIRRQHKQTVQKTDTRLLIYIDKQRFSLVFLWSVLSCQRGPLGFFLCNFSFSNLFWKAFNYKKLR